MKQTFLLTLLLGFGIMVPFTCSKTNPQKESAQQKKCNPTQTNGKCIALYGPVVKTVMQSKA